MLYLIEHVEQHPQDIMLTKVILEDREGVLPVVPDDINLLKYDLNETPSSILQTVHYNSFRIPN